MCRLCEERTDITSSLIEPVSKLSQHADIHHEGSED